MIDTAHHMSLVARCAKLVCNQILSVQGIGKAGSTSYSFNKGSSWESSFLDAYLELKKYEILNVGSSKQ
jgi:hypothetical protein